MGRSSIRDKKVEGAWALAGVQTMQPKSEEKWWKLQKTIDGL